MVGFSVLAIAARVASRSASRLRRAPITLTEEAASRIKDLLAKRNKVECSQLQLNPENHHTPSTLLCASAL